MADTLESLPMSILSGNYQQNYYKGSPMSDVVDKYRERQPGRDVDAARRTVYNEFTQGKANESYEQSVNPIKELIAKTEKELADLEEQLRLQTILNSSGAVLKQDTAVAPMQEYQPQDPAPQGEQQLSDSELWMQNYRKGM